MRSPPHPNVRKNGYCTSETKTYYNTCQKLVEAFLIFIAALGVVFSLVHIHVIWTCTHVID